MPLQWGTWKNLLRAVTGPILTGSKRMSYRGSRTVGSSRCSVRAVPESSVRATATVNRIFPSHCIDNSDANSVSGSSAESMHYPGSLCCTDLPGADESSDRHHLLHT